MSASAWASWLDRLESARGQEQVLANKIRSGNAAAIGTSVFALQQGVSRLKRDFDQLKRSSNSAVYGRCRVFCSHIHLLRRETAYAMCTYAPGGVSFRRTKQELERRERLLNQLAADQVRKDCHEANVSPPTAHALSTRSPSDGAPSKLLSMQNQIMKDQDQQLDLIGQGVSNLRSYSMTVKDETDLHVRLLNEIDDDVSRATDGLESESARASRVAKQSNNTKLYVTILILVVILIFLLLAGG
ncbi:hypothetical protein BBJ28_00006706 [Nothophytophthora sp. Chile5]|nr:hypothetical protein BBJ28_00006706 [Nothophytophthora sp. Chile5]